MTNSDPNKQSKAEGANVMSWQEAKTLMLGVILFTEVVAKIGQEKPHLLPGPIADNYNPEGHKGLTTDALIQAACFLRSQIIHTFEKNRPVNNIKAFCLQVMLYTCKHLDFSPRSITSIATKISTVLKNGQARWMLQDLNSILSESSTL